MSRCPPYRPTRPWCFDSSSTACDSGARSPLFPTGSGRFSSGPTRSWSFGTAATPMRCLVTPLLWIESTRRWADGATGSRCALPVGVEAMSAPPGGLPRPPDSPPRRSRCAPANLHSHSKFNQERSLASPASRVRAKVNSCVRARHCPTASDRRPCWWMGSSSSGRSVRSWGMAWRTCRVIGRRRAFFRNYRSPRTSRCRDGS